MKGLKWTDVAEMVFLWASVVCLVLLMRDPIVTAICIFAACSIAEKIVSRRGKL